MSKGKKGGTKPKTRNPVAGALARSGQGATRVHSERSRDEALGKRAPKVRDKARLTRTLAEEAQSNEDGDQT